MADSKISALTPASALGGTEMIPMVQGGGDVRSTPNSIKTFLSLATVATSGSASDLSTGTLPAAQLPNPSAATLGGVQSIAAVSHKFLTAISTSGVPSNAQPVVADISDAGALASAAFPGAGIPNSTGSAWGASYTISGSGTVIALATSPSLTTPTLGVATATSINKMAITAPATSSTLAVADGKTATISNTLTFTGTDSSSVAFGAGGTVVYSTDARLTGFAGNNTQNANYTIVSGDVGKVIRHTDASNYTYTLDTYANQPVAANQAITITCESTGTLTIAAPSGGSLIRLDGTAGTGNRTVGAASVATLYKLDGANAWAIWGTALS